jgi:hypothetical protein
MRTLVLITLLKLAVATIPGGSADIVQQRQQAERFLAGADTLDPNASNPAAFLLGHNLLVAAALTAARATATPFHFWIRVPATLADLGVAWLVARIAGRRAGLLYMLSPVSLLLTTYHGQVHTVATALAFVAVWLGVKDRAVPAGIVLGLAACVRQHFVILAVPLARAVSRGPWLALVGLAVVMVLVNFPLVFSSHVERTVTPPAGFGTWGYTIVLVNGPRVLSRLGVIDLTHHLPALLAVLPMVSSVIHFGWAAAFAARIGWGRPLDAWHAALLFLVGIYALTPAWGIQWLIWALPFWTVVSQRGALTYSGLAGAFLAVSYWVWQFNAKYGIYQITANLGVLSPLDLTLYFFAGALGIATWAYCAWTAWTLWRS